MDTLIFQAVCFTASSGLVPLGWPAEAVARAFSSFFFRHRLALARLEAASETSCGSELSRPLLL